jgi:hypothetical protein
MITSEQVQAARVLRWEQKDLAATLKVSSPSINRLENGCHPHSPIESAGVEFIAENGGGLGVPLKKTKRRTR